MSCNDNIINLNEGAQGDPGISSYTYIGYADTNTGTNFSLTPLPTSKYVAFKSDNVLFTPTVTYFAGLWTLYKGADGVGAAGINIELNNTPVTSGVTTINFAGAGLSGVTVADAGGNQTDVTITTAGLIEVTRSTVLNLITLNTLKTGAYYWIYDVGDGEGLTSGFGGIILRAITNNKFESQGVFVARNVNRTAVPNSINLSTNYAINNVIEFQNEVYICLIAGLPTTEPSRLTGQFNFVTKNNNTYYTTEIQNCIYDVSTNFIHSRWDKRGNVLTNIRSVGTTISNNKILKGFRWGYESFTNNKINFVDTDNTFAAGRLPNDISFSFWNIQGTLNNNIFNNCVINYFSFVNPYLFGSVYNNTFTEGEIVFTSSIPTSLYNNLFISTYITLSSGTISNCFALNSNLTIAIANISSSSIKNSTVTSVGLSNCEILNSQILNGFTPGTTITDSIIKNTTIASLIVINDSNLNYCNIPFFAGAVGNLIEYCDLTATNFSSNINTTLTYSKGSLYINNNVRCNLKYINGYGAISQFGGIQWNQIINNTDCRIEDNNISLGFIQNNTGVFIAYNHIANGYIQGNVNSNYPTVPINSCMIVEIQLNNEAVVETNTWITAGRIQRGIINGSNGKIKNISFNTATSVALGTVATVARTGTMFAIDNFTLDNVTIDGNSTSLSILTSAINSIANLPDYYDNVQASKATNSMYAFLDISNAAIFTAGVLTIPTQYIHAGIFYLYNCAGQTISQINIAAPLWQGSLTFKRLNDAQTISFQPTAIASLSANKFSSTTGALITLASIYDFIEFKRSLNNLYVSNYQIMIP